MAVSGGVLSCIHKTCSEKGEGGGGEAAWFYKEIKESLLACRKSRGKEKERRRRHERKSSQV